MMCALTTATSCKRAAIPSATREMTVLAGVNKVDAQESLHNGKEATVEESFYLRGGSHTVKRHRAHDKPS